MDISLLYTAGMRACGRVLKVLPQKEIGSPMEYLHRVFVEETLPTLDELIPQLIRKTFKISALLRVSDGDTAYENPEMANSLGAFFGDCRYNGFRIPPALVGGCEVTGIKNYFEGYSTSSQTTGLTGDGFGNMYPNKYGRYSSANIYARAWGNALNYADAQLLGTMLPALRMMFYEPNILFINKPFSDMDDEIITVVFRVKNDENLMSVSSKAFDNIKTLFILDVRKSIYNEYGMFKEIDTPMGAPVDPGISDWSSAESDREQKYQEYKQTAHFRNNSMMSG